MHLPISPYEMTELLEDPKFKKTPDNKISFLEFIRVLGLNDEPLIPRKSP